MIFTNNLQIIDQLATYSLCYSWVRFSTVKASGQIFITARKTSKKSRKNSRLSSFDCTSPPLIFSTIEANDFFTPQYNSPVEDCVPSPYDNQYSLCLPCITIPSSALFSELNGSTNVVHSDSTMIFEELHPDFEELSKGIEKCSIDQKCNVITTESSNNDLEVKKLENPGCIVSTQSKKISRKRELTKTNRDTICSNYFAAYNRLIFDSQLPESLPITWNSRLVKTAGITQCKESVLQKESVRSAAIELSVKVVDSKARLHETLLHELCHAAAWLIDGVRKPPHGRAFRKWADKIQRVYPGTTVSTCHTYDIFQPYLFICSNDSCGQEYSRHSKKGIDLERSRCGKCRSVLRYVGMKNVDGSMATPKAPSAFSLFVKEKFSTVKASEPSSTHKDVMKRLALLYKESKVVETADDNTPL